MKLGLIAGGGNLPQEIIKKAKQAGLDIFVILLKNNADKNCYINCNFIEANFGEVGKILSFFKDNQVSHIIFAGSIDRPSLASIIPDWQGTKLLAKLTASKISGDDNLLKVIGEYLESKNFKLVAAHELIPNLVENKSKYLTKIKPDADDLQTIKYAIKTAKKLGELDIGQSVIAEDNYVIGVEAAEGTDKLISRCKELKKVKNKKSAILIKSCKPNQDLRFDMPTIGLETIKNLVANNYKGIAIEKSKLIILNKEEIIELANKENIFIYVFDKNEIEE